MAHWGRAEQWGRVDILDRRIDIVDLSVDNVDQLVDIDERRDDVVDRWVDNVDPGARAGRRRGCERVEWSSGGVQAQAEGRGRRPGGQTWVRGWCLEQCGPVGGVDPSYGGGSTVSTGASTVSTDGSTVPTGGSTLSTRGHGGSKVSSRGHMCGDYVDIRTGGWASVANECRQWAGAVVQGCPTGSTRWCWWVDGLDPSTVMSVTAALRVEAVG